MPRAPRPGVRQARHLHPPQLLRHPSLSVHVSFVRSATMDTWTKAEARMMEKGGNNRQRKFFDKYGLQRHAPPGEVQSPDRGGVPRQAQGGSGGQGVEETQVDEEGRRRRRRRGGGQRFRQRRASRSRRRASQAEEGQRTLRPRQRHGFAHQDSLRTGRRRRVAAAVAETSARRRAGAVPHGPPTQGVGQVFEAAGQAGRQDVPPEEDVRGRARAGGGGHVGTAAAAAAAVSEDWQRRDDGLRRERAGRIGRWFRG